MNLKIALFGATALGMLMATGVVYAAGLNSTTLKEVGNNNVLLIQQDDTSGGNTAGTGGQPIDQEGDHNSVNAQQSAGSQLGLGATIQTSGYEFGPYKPSTYTSGVDQTGDHNSLTVTQTNGTILQVQQTAPHGSPQGDTNSATITQTSNFAGGAYIGSVTQTYTGTYGTDPNTLSVTQTTSTHDASASRAAIDTIFQRGWKNGLTLTQTQGNNTLIEAGQDGTNNQGSVKQTGSSNWMSYFDQIGNGNSAGVTFSGNRNGGNNFNTNSPVGASGWNFATNSGAAHDTLRQNGDGNSALVEISGNLNIFGVDQEGIQNSIGGLNIDGDSNSVGLYQKNNGNVISIATVTGNYNDIGVTQNGPTNTAAINSSASDSRLRVNEVGGSNNISATQSGSWGYINASATGNDNHLIVRQANAVGGTPDSSTTGNTATVTIIGSNNNDPSLTAGLSSASLTAWTTGLADDATFNTLGDVYQSGSNNNLVATINTDSNDFMTLQEGSSNMITHTVSNGTGNVAVIVQNGSGNTSTTTQAGQGNNIGVTQ